MLDLVVWSEITLDIALHSCIVEKIQDGRHLCKVKQYVYIISLLLLWQQRVFIRVWEMVKEITLKGEISKTTLHKLKISPLFFK